MHPPPHPPPRTHQVNYNLLAVNLFMACTGTYQLYRKISWDMQQGSAPPQQLTAAAAAAAAEKSG